jgi:CheY-like chemotaxis protein
MLYILRNKNIAATHNSAFSHFQEKSILFTSLLPAPDLLSLYMPPKQILLVEDDAPTRHTLAFVLQDEGFIVIEAADGQEALDILVTTVPDLVITDNMMPRLDGLGLLSQIRQRFPTLPVLFYSAVMGPKLESQVRQLGVVAYLSKPLRLDELLQLISTVLGAPT